MRVLESTIEKKVVAAAYKKWGIRSIKLNGPGARGWPDRLFLIPGNPSRPLFIEFKSPTGRVSVIQRRNHEIIRDAGFEVYVCSDFEDVMGLIKSMREPLYVHP